MLREYANMLNAYMFKELIKNNIHKPIYVHICMKDKYVGTIS